MDANYTLHSSADSRGLWNMGKKIQTEITGGTEAASDKEWDEEDLYKISWKRDYICGEWVKMMGKDGEKPDIVLFLAKFPKMR